ncbi:MAG: hypothetical protein R6V85_19145 [Polyangia bacterium]
MSLQLAICISLAAAAGCGGEDRAEPRAATSPSAPERERESNDEKIQVEREGEVRCPVCGLEFDASEAVAERSHRGREYYFLLKDHAEAFAAAPSRYLKEKGALADEAGETSDSEKERDAGTSPDAGAE